MTDGTPDREGRDLAKTAERAREIAAEASGPVDTPGDAVDPRSAGADVTREVYDDDSGAIERSQRIRAADDARTGERQEELAKLEAEAAELLRRNAESLRRTAEDLAETRDRMREIAADTRELAADTRATREDTSRVVEAVRSTPPVVEPPTKGPPAGQE